VPLLERLRFLTYCSRNLDEFFMVRVGATRDLIDAGIREPSPDGLTPQEQMRAIRERVRALIADLYACLDGQLLPALAARGVTVESFRDVGPDEQRLLRDRFRRDVAPVLTPLAIDPGHPFPFVANLSLNVAAIVYSERVGEHLVLMKIPPSLPRLFALAGGRRFVPIGSIVIAHLGDFFPTLTVRRAFLFRVIRNTELSLDDDEVEDLRESVEAELRRRERKQVVCLEIAAAADEEIVAALIRGTGAQADDVYSVPGFLKPNDLAEIAGAVPDADLHFEPFQPRMPLAIAAAPDAFGAVREADVILHRPYDSFGAVIDLLHEAAQDPGVVAIKQTLYQTDERSPVIDQLVLAAQRGKQVSVVIELQARFEEKKNIALAARLQEAGAQVVYGIVGLQTHVKMLLIVRKEGDVLRRYVHLSTGNYNAATARAYTDVDLLTCNESFGRDASQLMNILTGYSANTAARLAEGEGRWERFIVAPFEFHRWLLGTIRREAEHARTGRPARIEVKLNSLVDPAVIRALYEASGAGVEIRLVVRATCSLVPGVPGLSERIRVTSIVGRFLEHSRIIRYANGGETEVYLSSGDWMPRNFLRRVELTFPVLDLGARARVEGILDAALAEVGDAWELQPDGTWERFSLSRAAKTARDLR